MVIYSDPLTTLIRGDCRHALREIPLGSVNAIWTDPPYGHANAQGDLLSRIHQVAHRATPTRQRAIANDRPDQYRQLLDDVLVEAARVLTPESSVCCCCCGGGGPSPAFAWLAQRMDMAGLQFDHAVIWDKVHLGLGWRFRRQYEMVLVAHRRGGTLAWQPGQAAIRNVIRIPKPRPRAGEPWHPNLKPLDLVSQMLQSMLAPGMLLLDPFCGSGTALIAARRLGIRSIGIELSRRWADQAVARLRLEPPIADYPS